MAAGGRGSRLAMTVVGDDGYYPGTAPPDLLFPITDRTTALDALRMARLSIREARKRGVPETSLTEAKEDFRRGWKRRLAELDLHGLPADPF